MSNLIQSLNRDQGLDVSERYKVIKTGDLVSQLETEGYVVRELKQQKSRKQEYQGFGKHALRMRHSNLVLNREGLTPEIVLRNSYNGTSCFEIMLGVFRLVCSNGLVVGTTFESLKVRHVGDVMPKVFDALTKIQSQTEKMRDDIDRFSAKQLTQNEIHAFARQVASALIPKTIQDIDGQTSSGVILETVKPLDLLRVKRGDDQGQDLWTILNVIQENALNGGLRYMSQNETGVIRRNSSRQIRSIDRNIEVNRLVWDIASQIEAGKIAA